MLKRFIPSVAWAAILSTSLSLHAQEPVLRPPETSRNSPDRDDADRAFEVLLGAEPRHSATGRYRYQNGRWWYLSRENRWFVWQNKRWTAWSSPARQEAPRTAPFAKSPGFDRRFAAYLDYQVGQGRLRSAEGGDVELATDEISEPGAEDAVAEAMELGGIPRRQAERRHAGMHHEAEEQRPEWFKSGSPFGVRYGYGSGFGYSGYGYNNPYGYGPRTGSGGAFSYGFGPYGAVGGQTSSRMSGIGGGGPNLISAEPSSLGAPGGL
ncbi:MAG TPA: hypothetical protein VFI31_13585, partial [Pirellulales bacterium]|nr:hypothetical protein [Pirellulales bacterium]